MVGGFMAQLLGAVAYMHSFRIVHRDIKPANIMLQNLSAEIPVVKLIDFGLASRCPEGTMLENWGTPDYMLPEQLRGGCNEACDVWASGCVMYELLSCGDMLIPCTGFPTYEMMYIFLLTSRLQRLHRVKANRSDTCFDLIRRLLCFAYGNSITARAAADHAFLARLAQASVPTAANGGAAQLETCDAACPSVVDTAVDEEYVVVDAISLPVQSIHPLDGVNRFGKRRVLRTRQLLAPIPEVVEGVCVMLSPH